MKKNVLLRTNIVICTVIIMGFLATSIISYHFNHGIMRKDIEHISLLTSEGIYHEIDSIFAKPINISLTMANDSLLRDFLLEEETQGDNEDFIQVLQDYLCTYKEKYDYDSVFLVSATTNRYYHFEQGVDRVLTEDNPENVWYYSFLSDPGEYALNIDNDEVASANNKINIFINCKIYSLEKELMGVVGVGFGVDTLQELLQQYEDNFGLRAYLIDGDGMIELSTTETGYEKKDLFEGSGYAQERSKVLGDRGEGNSFWYSSGGQKGYLVTRYVPNMEWHLIIENDTTALDGQMNRQFLLGVIVILLVISIVLVIITGIIRKYNAQIVKLTIEREKEHRSVFQEETEKLYENIYEMDITHNCAASEATESYFESLGVPKKMPFSEALKVIASEQIKAEYREGYINTFTPENVLKAYEEGRESLRYDFMTTNDGGYSYYWIRITARIFFWKDDQSVRLLVYRENIDPEKQRELQMEEKMQRDSLSGLYNKAATQERIRQMLVERPERPYAFFILDIDHFKKVNDTYGHAVGDLVITDFSGKLKGQFREGDIVGRIGGDEFVVFVPVPSREWAEQKAKELASRVLCYVFTDGEKSCTVSTSIGVALMPEAGVDFETLYQNADSALYQTKKKGRRGYTIFHEA